ncbi:hypothetical protein SDC9_121762 [bioreactor metagenome]|uniref:Uncharacterized protein n=1 Tax=bioreactor metagenome TaxID=1076179 RepID=A0A645CCZ2_9ZZZZ
MPEVAKMLGVEIGEEFEIIINEMKMLTHGPYKITDNAIVDYVGCKTKTLLYGLLTGEYTLQKRPWRPKVGDAFFYVLTNGEIQKYVFEIDNIHTLMLFSFDNCFPTEEAARAAVPEMMAKFEEIKKGVRP